MDSKFGKKLLETKTSGGQLFRRRLLFIIPALVFIAAGVFSLMRPEYAEDNLSMTLVLFFGVGIWFLLLGMFLVKASNAIIYEGGLLISKGSKVTELSFDNLEGISDYTNTVTLRIMIFIPISKTKTRTLMIATRNGKKIQLVNSSGGGVTSGINKSVNALMYSLTNFDQFADELTTVFTKYLLKNITKENLKNAYISFGDGLELVGGTLVFRSQKGNVDIALASIGNIKAVGNEGYWMSIEDKAGEELASVRADKALNLEALYKLVEMSQK